MQNTYYLNVPDNRERNIAIVMAFIGLILSLGVSIYYVIYIFNENKIEALKLIATLSQWASKNPSSSFLISIIDFLIALVLIAYFTLPLSTFIYSIAVLITKGCKKKIAIAMYILIGLTLCIFIRNLF